MPDPYRKMTRGDGLRKLQAATLNGAIDAARAERATRLDQPGRAAPPAAPLHGPTTVRVQNATGGALGQFAVVALSDPVVSATDNLAEWQAKPNLTGEAPAAAADLFAVLLDPLPDGAIGRGVVAGAVPCQVYVSDVTHAYAAPSPGLTDRLASAASGPAVVLWREAGTGLKWALVLIAPGVAAGATPFNLTVAEVDGSPSLAGTVEIDFDQGDGFVVSAVSTGIVKVKLSPTLVVREQDGSPSYSATGTITFDQADGFVVSQPAAGEARVDLASASNTQKGIVDLTGGQVLGAGDKFFSDKLFVSCTSAPSYMAGSEKLSVNGVVGCTGVFMYDGAGASAAQTGASNYWILQQQESGGDTIDISLFNTSHTGNPFLPDGPCLMLEGKTGVKYTLREITGGGGTVYQGGSTTTGGLTFKGGLYISGTAGSSPTGAAGGSLAGTYPNPTIAAGAVGTTELATNAVTTAKITDANVTTAKIADANVTTAKVADNAITEIKLAATIDLNN